VATRLRRRRVGRSTRSGCPAHVAHGVRTPARRRWRERGWSFRFRPGRSARVRDRARFRPRARWRRTCAGPSRPAIRRGELVQAERLTDRSRADENAEVSDDTKARPAFAPWDRRELPGLFTVEESARRVGNYKWTEMRLFEVLGGWVATIPEL